MAKVGSSVGLEGAASIKNPGPTYGRAVNMGGYGGEDIVGGSGVVLVGGVIAGGTRGMGWELGGRVVDMAKRDTCS